MPNNSKPNITAATGRDAVFHTIPKPTVCYSESVILFRRLLMLVEIASRSIYICPRQRGITIVKWFTSYAKSMDRADPHIVPDTGDTYSRLSSFTTQLNCRKFIYLFQVRLSTRHHRKLVAGISVGHILINVEWLNACTEGEKMKLNYLKRCEIISAS